MAQSKRAPEHYVNNKDFTQAVVDYKLAIEEAKKAKEEAPPIPDYVAECIFRIAEGLSHKPGFFGYSWRQDMVMDGVEDSIKALGNFKVKAKTRSGKPNAFAYFTQICWYAFLRRIAKEKKQQAIKDKIISTASVEAFIVNDDHADGNSMVDRMRRRHEQY